MDVWWFYDIGNNYVDVWWWFYDIGSLFHNEQHTKLRGKEARVQVLKYYDRDHNKGVEGTENCNEDQTKQLRSRTALTRKGPSSRLLGSSFMKPI